MIESREFIHFENYSRRFLLAFILSSSSHSDSVENIFRIIVERFGLKDRMERLIERKYD